MSDQLDQEIEDLLGEIEDFEWHRRHRRGHSRARQVWSTFWQRVADGLARRLVHFSSGHLMLIGFLTLVLGLVLRLRGLGIWLTLAGIILFFLGLAWSMRGGGRPSAYSTRGGYWRDRYITYSGSAQGGLLGWFRRWRR